MTFPFAANEIPGAGKFGEGPQTYDPDLVVSGTAPTLGSGGFLVGRWWRSILTVTAIVDLFVDTAANGGDLDGTSWRISLPMPVHSIHVGGTLAAASDAIGSFQSRSGTASQSTSGSVLLDGNGRMIFYGVGTNTSIGSGSFTSSARIKAIVNYAAEPGV